MARAGHEKAQPDDYKMEMKFSFTPNLLKSIPNMIDGSFESSMLYDKKNLVLNMIW